MLNIYGVGGRMWKSLARGVAEENVGWVFLLKYFCTTFYKIHNLYIKSKLDFSGRLKLEQKNQSSKNIYNYQSIDI